MKRQILLFVAGAAVAAGAASAAPGPQRTVNPAAGPVGIQVTCRGALSQVCNPAYTLRLNVGPGRLVTRMVFTASRRHCSSIRIAVRVNGRVRPTSRPLGPRESHSVSLGRLSAGRHVVTVKAVGTLGGCNAGYLASWAGVVRFTSVRV